VLTDQIVRKVGGHPAHLHGMDHDVIHHIHFAHYLIALCFGWDLECHREHKTPELMNRCHSLERLGFNQPFPKNCQSFI
jgi:hypothetical protein